MKIFLRKLFAPILNCFESGEGEFTYRPSHRTILMAVGALFGIVAVITCFGALGAGQLSAYIPVVVFAGVSMVCLVVSFLGNERAIATIWGSK